MRPSVQTSRIILVKGLILVIVTSTAALGLYGYLAFPDITALAKTNPRTTAFIEARAKETKAQGRSARPLWIWIPLSRVSPHLQRAVVVAEDASFFHHHGFDWEGIRYAASRNWKRGESRRGGSTITQQLAKNLYLSPEKNYWRKIHEAIITRALEKHLTKRRILELYLNVVEWGRGVYGAEAAARHHFGKSAQELDRAEAALLAAILPSPRRHDPLRVTTFLNKRQQQILRWMQDGTMHTREAD